MRHRRGISLIEVTISMVIVSLMSMGVIRMVGIAAVTRAQASDRVRGLNLAMDMLQEIKSQHWADPSNSTDALGPDPGEFDGKTRLNYNDVDDYHGWEQQPPLDRSGNPLPGYEGWSRSVTVQYAVLSGGHIVPSGSRESGKLITVTVRRHGRLVAEVQGYRSSGFDRVRSAALPPSGEVVE